MLTDNLDKYIKCIHDRVGDYLFDPEPVYEPLLEKVDRGKIKYMYEVLSDLREQIVIEEMAREKDDSKERRDWRFDSQ